MTFTIKQISILIIVVVILSCSKQQIVQVDKSDVSKCLPFLKLGLTEKQEILDRLGDPANSYEGGRIITYTVCDGGIWRVNVIKCDEKISRGIEAAVYTLVLIFGPKNELEQYSLVRTRYYR